MVRPNALALSCAARVDQESCRAISSRQKRSDLAREAVGRQRQGGGDIR
jgi:hypothetical protein